MSLQIAGQYLYTFLASGAVALSFLASMAQSIVSREPHPLFAADQPPPVLTDPTILSWLGFVGALAAVGGKAYVDYRARKRDADIADAHAWGVELVTARRELGDAQAALGRAKDEIVALKAQNHAQGADIKVMQAKLAKLASSQNDVITVVNKQQARVKDAVKRVGEIENTLGSSSNLEIHVKPTEPSESGDTTLDAPTIN